MSISITPTNLSELTYETPTTMELAHSQGDIHDEPHSNVQGMHRSTLSYMYVVQIINMVIKLAVQIIYLESAPPRSCE